MRAERQRRTPVRAEGPSREYVALNGIAGTKGRPSRATIFAIVRWRRIRTYKFAGDRKTYARRADLERALGAPAARTKGR